MTEEEFNEEVEDLKKKVRLNFERSKCLVPVAILFNETGMILLPLHELPTKDAWAIVIVAAAKRFSAFGLVHISEAWTAWGVTPEEVAIADIEGVERNPKSVECVMINTEFIPEFGNAQCKTYFAEIKRPIGDEDNPKLLEFREEEFDNREGRMTRLLPGRYPTRPLDGEN